MTKADKDKLKALFDNGDAERITKGLRKVFDDYDRQKAEEEQNLASEQRLTASR